MTSVSAARIGGGAAATGAGAGAAGAGAGAGATTGCRRSLSELAARNWCALRLEVLDRRRGPLEELVDVVAVIPAPFADLDVAQLLGVMSRVAMANNASEVDAGRYNRRACCRRRNAGS